ncbi:lytic transglycosylase domain-containing protein [Lichenibacterium dinghuense]|uniref:lytic transglycosylase domain-containing protein n=1 Tax=Lichenibacterium dinghuense TaxID=2895977 RepID=UPI001F3F63DD|nr:lytic transglycosylase domain-containing protein [Lichenibacterium sp. 6Y81]
MAYRGLRIALMAGTGLALAALAVPSVRHAVESAPRRWAAHGTGSARLAPPPGLDLAARRRDIRTATVPSKSSLRAEPLAPEAAQALAEAMASTATASPAAADPSAKTLTIGGHGSPTGLATPGPAAGPSQPGTPTENGAPPGPSIADHDSEAPLLRQAVDAYRRNDLAGGDAAARGLTNPLARLTAEWAAVRLDSHLVGLARLDAFGQAHPDWPALAWVQRRAEEAVAATRDPALIEARLGASPPKTTAGRLALAQAERTLGHPDVAARLAHAMWRDDDLSPWQEATLARDFADVIDREDHRIRAEHFLYKEKVALGLREAALAGPDVAALAKARAAVIGNSALSESALAAVPKALQSDPLAIFSRVQRLRRQNRAEEAADLILTAPRDARVVDGDEWWTERRIVIRKLLDLGDPKKALQLCADIGEAGTASRIEAAFHAGWIALRFLQDPRAAAPQFDTIARLAETPISKSRAAYWQGRTAEALGQGDEAERRYAEAARYSITFYGQLAAARLGRTDLELHEAPSATGDVRSDAVKVADYLYALGARDVALPLALDIGKAEPSDAQVGALGDVLERNRDARTTLTVGKAATQRGLAVDDAAFPTFGIPNFNPLPGSADLSVVYAIARQESEFDQRSLSSAGAKGLMQMISSTARTTANRAGVAYDDGRLSSDPAFNAQLGAAHLGTLLGEQNGSFVLTFAAYNAGGKAVHDWIAAYGDPRRPGIDVVDWIERIPYSETRNYVQRVMENLQVYRAKLGRPPMLLVGAEPPPPIRKGT